jgi:DNA-binding transcriptional ArsR family regulator
MADDRAPEWYRLDKEVGLEREAAQMVASLKNPVRRMILRCLHAADGARSPRELAAELERPHRDVVHHVAVLEEAEAVAPVDAAQRAGSIEYSYVSTVEGDGGFCLVLIAAQRPDEGR